MNSAGQPSVVVGISTYNRADILPKAIASALSQNYPGVSVAVVNDASTDSTNEIAGRFPAVSWTSWTSNRGYVEARNLMMLESTASYYVSLDDDAWFIDCDEISLAVELMEAQKDVAAVAFDILSPDRPTPTRRTQAKPVAMFIGCGHVLRLEPVRRLNGYAIFPGAYGAEEKDLCLRLIDAGYKIVKMPGVHVWHDKAATARDLSSQHCSGVCNDLALALRRTPLIVLPLSIAWKLFRHMHFSASRQLLGPYFKGVRAFAQAAPKVWRTRGAVTMRTLQKFRKLSEG